MYLSKSPTFRFWVTVYAAPSMVPLILLLAFDWRVKQDLIVALGSKGSAVADEITQALFVSFALLVVLANAMAFWHVTTRKPAIPGPAPVSD